MGQKIKIGTPDYFVFDTETGGFSSQKHGLCEIAGLLIDGVTLDIIMEYETIIKPYDTKLTYTAEAQAVHGLSVELLEEQGEDANTVVQELRTIFEESNSNKKRSGQVVLVGHNVNFDIGFLDHLFTHQGEDLAKYVKSERIRNQFSYPKGIDTIDLCHARWAEDNLASFKLGDCCIKGEIEIADSHRAMNDTIPTYELFKQAVLAMRNSGSIEKTETKRQFKF